MREDEVEALLRLDGAGLRVGQEYAGFRAEVRHPAVGGGDTVMFTGQSPTRQEAIAIAWQKYQQFMSTEVGRAHLSDHNGQMLFRM